MVVVLLMPTAFAWAQQVGSGASETQSAAMSAAIHDLQQQVSELRAAVAEVRSEAAQYRAETAQLRKELQATRDQLATESPVPAYPNQTAPAEAPAAVQVPASPSPLRPASLEDRVASLEESTQLLNGKIDEQYQTKVASASRYRVRLSGIVLMNLFDNRGAVDNQDFPTWATPVPMAGPNGVFGATLRQSEIGLEVFGPTLAGAKTSGEVSADFSGGFPNLVNGVTSGLFRLRTADLRLDWDQTSLVIGQDNLFLSPLSPTSFASLAVPSLSYAGNLWGWIPQVRVEHRFDLSENDKITLQAGILDNLDGEEPYFAPENQPSAGEGAGQPGYGLRTAWTRTVFGQPMTFGAAGYYARQAWGFGHHTDGWAGMTDWQIPLPARLSLSGEFYRGFAIGGFGGALGRSVLFSDQPGLPGTAVHGLNTIGGWSQLKFKAMAKLEFNGGIGVDSPYAKDLGTFNNPQGYLPFLAQNRGAVVNFIYRPRSNLLFSTEYHRLRTFSYESASWTANQVNGVMGILF